MRVALYARVPTDHQEKEGTVGSQLDALQARAQSEGWAVEMTCTDDGYSGTSLDRPGLDRARDAAAAGLIDAVVVLCPDRLARNYVHQMIVLDELRRFGVSVLFCEGGPADDPQGRLMAQIQAAVAEFEATKIAERNRRGKLWRARQGAVVSGQVPFGYRKVPASDGLPARLVICEDEAAIVRQIFDWHANEGLSVRQVAIRLIEACVPAPSGKQILAYLYLGPAAAAACLRRHALLQPAHGAPTAGASPSTFAWSPPNTLREASRRVDRRGRAAHHRPRHLGTLPSRPPAQQPVQPTPRRRRVLPAPLHSALRRVRPGPNSYRKDEPERPPALLLLPGHAPATPARREAALLTAIGPGRRARRAGLVGGAAPLATTGAHAAGLHRRRPGPNRCQFGHAPAARRAAGSAPSAPRRLPGRRDQPCRPRSPTTAPRRAGRGTGTGSCAGARPRGDVG